MPLVKRRGRALESIGEVRENSLHELSFFLEWVVSQEVQNYIPIPVDVAANNSPKTTLHILGT
jgi:hypothetical protein